MVGFVFDQVSCPFHIESRPNRKVHNGSLPCRCPLGRVGGFTSFDALGFVFPVLDLVLFCSPSTALFDYMIIKFD